MNRSPKRFLATLLILPLVVVMAACGSDDDSGGSSNGGGGNGEAPGLRDTSVEPRDEYAEYCDKTEELIESDTPPAESARAQLEVAPDDLKEDIQLMLDWVELQEQPDADPQAVADAEAEGQPAALRVFSALKTECGITVPLL